MTAKERSMMETRIKTAFSDRQFVQELFSLDSPEDAQSKLREKGIILSLDEVRMIPRALKKAQQIGDELSESDLEDVAAGVITPMAVLLIAGCVAAYGASAKNRTW